ncbi:hypothetical protein BJ944DRAFT_165751 [Cunninghamella echinulata]|nr:hypothetical protein BJ944DRAFT_165751 [Cunninghamella echinulata]
MIERPDSPEPYSDIVFNSDDHIPTSDLGKDEIDTYQHQQQQQQDVHENKLVIVGVYDQRITLGRGGSSTIKIGRRNRQISRTHLAIEYCNGRFELVILGLNGATVDHLPYKQYERAPLDDHSIVDVIGDIFEFRFPSFPPPSSIHKSSLSSSPSLSTFEIKQHSSPSSPPPLSSTNQYDINNSITTKKHNNELDLLSNNNNTNDNNKNDKENNKVDKNEHDKENETTSYDEDQDSTDYSELIIDILVFSKKSSMPISDICSRILKTNPQFKKQNRDVWNKRIQQVLKEKPFFGEIVRKGKTADGSPKENLYYYNSDMDPIEWRRATYTQVGRSARKCTLQDKQYFWRIPPKLGKNRNAYIPPPGPPILHDKRKVIDQHDNDNNDGDLSFNTTIKKQKH